MMCLKCKQPMELVLTTSVRNLYKCRVCGHTEQVLLKEVI